MRRRKTKGKGGNPSSHAKGNADRDGSSIATSSKRVDFLGTGRGFAVTAILLFSARLLSSAFNIVHDCDETYNYWEPLHYLLYKSGFQTWEYRYAYATPLLSGALAEKLFSIFDAFAQALLTRGVLPPPSKPRFCAPIVPVLASSLRFRPAFVQAGCPSRRRKPKIASILWGEMLVRASVRTE